MGDVLCLLFDLIKMLVVLGSGGVVLCDDDVLVACLCWLRWYGRDARGVYVELGFNL